ncbi:phage head closure protein [Chitinasiproducens palmae]|uniref:Phage head-tail adaptor, putative, SPP1 family n=1 Tax=Chitinasiproducens palmae TaxID=1770053 RepID=A0A1H2PT53_9BURK|nr:phage head closure protein [Chitinasiproducens palmae]SDV49817.1 phage head-tail adaptor, putative, SPP1 family [Chitinasiproducens palmae]
MRAGPLNRRVRIEQRTDAADPETGQPRDEWVPVAEVWANVLLLTGKESVQADAEVASATASIRIRYRTDITNGMRAVLLKYVDGQPVDDVVFDILTALPAVATRDYTDLACATGANNG